MIPLRDSVPARSQPVVTWVLIGVNVYVKPGKQAL